MMRIDISQKSQLDEALTKTVQTIMEQLAQDDEGGQTDEHHGESNNNVSHVEGVVKVRINFKNKDIKQMIF